MDYKVPVKKKLLGLPIYDITMIDLVRFLDQKIKNNDKLIVFGISAGAYGRLKYRRDLAKIYHQMDLLIAEGQGIPLLAKLFGVNISEHIGLVNLTFKMLEIADQNSYKVLLFGATKEINDKAGDIIKRKYPNLILCEGINGYFKQDDEEQIVNKINSEAPDILLIGITYPIKERFSVKYKSSLNTKVIIPCGGVFDVIAGRAKRPPIRLKWIPITWLYRYLQEPRRLFKPIIITVLYSIFWVFPILYFKHISHIERNPSILKFHKIYYITK